ncbi:MAG: ArnT family glycosyltransferase [Candidatus Omnitrophota bacterium]
MKLFYQALAIFFLAICFNAAGTVALPLVDRDEPRFAEAAREMRERGDWVVPYFNNEPRLAKPPLIYWCQAASYGILGETDFAARFPSVLAAALTALLVFGFGRRLYDEKTGLWAAVVFTLSLHALALAKAATADMAMIFFFTAASWAGWELIQGSKGSDPSGTQPVGCQRGLTPWWWVFYLSLALGFLTKGPVAWIPLGAVALFARLAGVQNVRQTMRFEIGIPLALFVIGLWAVPALLQTNGEYFTVGIGKHVLGRSVEAMEGHGGRGLLSYALTLPFYFITVFPSFFPWSAFLPALFSHLRRPENRGAREIYLLAGILLTFFIFTFAATKLPHYTLPAFPLLAVLSAGIYFKTGGSEKLLRVGAAGMTLLVLAVSFILFPIATRAFPAADLARQSSPWLKPEMEFASVEFNEPSLVWTFRKYVRGWHRALSPEDAASFMQKPGSRFCILPSPLAEQVFPKMDPEWKRFRSQGINLAKGKKVDLAIVVKTG